MITDLRVLEAEIKEEADEFAQRLMQRLSKIDKPSKLVEWLLRYDAFNRGFPGAAAQLAGRIACMIDHFGDLEAEMIASRVLAAITDEFLDRQTGATSLHSKW